MSVCTIDCLPDTRSKAAQQAPGPNVGVPAHNLPIVLWAVNNFAGSGHPDASPDNIEYFTSDYVAECLMHALKHWPADVTTQAKEELTDALTDLRREQGIEAALRHRTQTATTYVAEDTKS